MAKKELQVHDFLSKIEDFSDFNILSQEGTEFPCHKILLACTSPPMRAMMTHDMKERKEGQVTLPYQQEIVRYFVHYFYTKKVPEEVLEENLESFFSLAEKYDLQPLKLQAEEVAVKRLTTKNMVGMLHLADLYRAQQLREASEFL